MTVRQALHCDGIIGKGLPSPAPCPRLLTAPDPWMNATDVRKLAKDHGWVSGRKFYTTNGGRRVSIASDLCPAHAEQRATKDPKAAR